MLVSSSALVSEPRRVCGRNELIVIQARPISSFLVRAQQQNLAKYHIALQFNRAALVSPAQVSAPLQGFVFCLSCHDISPVEVP